MRSLAGVAAVFILIVLAVTLAFRLAAPEHFTSGDEQVRLVALLGWLTLLCAGVFLSSRIPIAHVLRSFIIWAGIGLFLVAIYALRDDFGDLYAKVRGELTPYAPAMVDIEPAEELDTPGGSAAAVRRAADGHFYAEAQVNGARVRFLVDTGASTVALTARDARRIGVDLDSLYYSVQVMTANGQARGAPVRLDRVSIGGVRLDNVEAIVIDGDGLGISLLGMSFLGRLSRYEATQDSLILRK